MPTWLKKWQPEDPKFWRETGRRFAWRTLTITTIALIFSFAIWFLMSALVVRLPGIGFKYTDMQLFWLAAMPGLAGGTLRMLHTFLIPVFGTRHVVTIATLLKLFPAVGIGLAVLNPQTPFWLFLILAFSAGLGGGDFSSFMPSTSLVFPKRLQGTALGLQAGIGNFGVTVVQFITPWIIGFAVFGAATGGPRVFTTATGATRNLWLQNAAFIYVPFLVIMGILAWVFLRSVPVRASFREQMDIFKNKHTWFCTITYMMTFGSFSGFSATFPLMIKSVYGGFADAPDPLKFAFLGPLVGSLFRILIGPVSDKIGGAVLTTVSGLIMIGSAIAMVFSGVFTPDSTGQFPLFVILMLVIFLASGTGNASTFRQYPIIFAHSPRQGAGVIGWTAAIAAYGPFIWSTFIGLAISRAGSPAPFFYGLAGFYVIATFVNWFYYQRKGCERPS
ncbi:MAG: MFS transporter [Chloroflexi bacterium RBG_16_56_11]|nr:MAG: MFS transporter [Chloroflexi bacterium RBG_16_56_11]